MLSIYLNVEREKKETVMCGKYLSIGCAWESKKLLPDEVDDERVPICRETPRQTHKIVPREGLEKFASCDPRDNFVPCERGKISKTQTIVKAVMSETIDCNSGEIKLYFTCFDDETSSEVIVKTVKISPQWHEYIEKLKIPNPDGVIISAVDSSGKQSREKTILRNIIDTLEIPKRESTIYERGK